MMPAFTIDEVLPHKGQMQLLHRLLEWSEEAVAAEVVVPAHGLFACEGGMPAWVGVEYMAQAVAAWAGYRARLGGRPPSIGFLLGTRRYSCDRAVFPAGARLRVEARCELLGENGLGMFACRIVVDGQEWAAANVSVYEPADAQAYLESDQA